MKCNILFCISFVSQLLSNQLSYNCVYITPGTSKKLRNIYFDISEFSISNNVKGMQEQ